MSLSVREMSLKDINLRIDYFHKASTDYLSLLGVDPEKLPSPAKMRSDYSAALASPIEQRSFISLIWLRDHNPIGFSTADQVVFGKQARMHLHILRATDRQTGIGVECVRQSVDFYFDRLKLKQLTCEPNAFNTAPNRTLQKAGFKYVETYETIPGPINFYQPVTRWRIDRS